MPEIISSFAGRQIAREFADAPPKVRYRSLGGLAQIALQFAERHLDRIQVRRIFGQKAERRGSMMSAGAGAARATGSSTTDRKICSTYSGGRYDCSVFLPTIT
jgi:hypothetical protein